MELDYYNWLFVFLRISAFLLVLPFFTMANFPVMMRVALGGLAAILLAPLLPPFAANHLDFFSLLGVMFQEVSVGLLLGIVARLIFFSVELLKAMIYQALAIAAPILLTAMVIGLCISLFQAVTTISEQTLTFVPKALAVIGIVLLLMPWIVRSLIEFTTSVIQKIPQMVQ